jgi:hypothetical protein
MERRVITGLICDWCGRPAATIEPFHFSYTIVCGNADCLYSATGTAVNLSSATKERSKMVDMTKYAGSSTFIKYDDVEGAPAKKTIVKVEPGKFDKPVLTFDDGTHLGLNKTNVRALVKAFGKNSDGWLDNVVELYGGVVEFQNKSFETVLINATPA